MSLRMSDLTVFLETPILRSARTAAVPGTISFHHSAAPQMKVFKLLVFGQRLGNRIKLIFVFVFKSMHVHVRVVKVLSQNTTT